MSKNIQRIRKRAIAKAMKKRGQSVVVSAIQPPAQYKNLIAQKDARIAELERQLQAAQMKSAQLEQQGIQTKTQLEYQRRQSQDLQVQVQSFKVLAEKTDEKLRQVIKETGYTKFGQYGTMAQYLEGNKPTFVERFIARLHESLPGWQSSWDNDVRQKLLSLDYRKIDNLMNDIHLTALYYESNAGAGTIDDVGTAGEVYEDIMQAYVPVDD